MFFCCGRGFGSFQGGCTDRTVILTNFSRFCITILLDIRKSSFQHFTADWNFKVIEMTIETIHFVQGLGRTPFLFSSIFQDHMFCKSKFMTSESVRFPKCVFSKLFSRFTNKCPDSRSVHRTQASLLLASTDKT